ncbi:MAG: FtsW/RodA/SpoVE family cell cycle protein [Gemmatimonadetes bacterium]|nr:FtsW/RodA/SpoVE family cell cycle protein [Gemmatimonadota bacterium]
MSLIDRVLRRGKPVGPSGVPINVRTHNRPELERREAAMSMPGTLGLGLLISTLFYLIAHYAVVKGVWPVHGTAPGSGGVLIRDIASVIGWLLLVVVMRAMKYRGNWAVIVLPIVIFLMIRPSLFQIFTDPVYQATGGTRQEANSIKAERSQLTTILRAYDQERQQQVFRGPPPELPDPIETVRVVTRPERNSLLRLASTLTVVVAPLAMLLAFMATRRPGPLRVFRDKRVWPFLVTFLAFAAMAAIPNVRATGKLAGMTPWELFLPIFVGVWAAVLADDAYNLGTPGQLISPRRILTIVLYGALPVIPFLAIHDLGLSIILAGSFAAMLLVGTRRAWWGGLMLVIWAGLVLLAFSVDERSQTRLALSKNPYLDLSAMTEPQREEWAAKVHQIKLFDANVLAGGLFGEGPGRGHAETAPNAADDGYITTVAAQWGLLGAIGFVLVYTAFVIQMLAVAVRERSAFERSLVTGLAMLIAIPFWLSALGGIRVVPLTGVAAAFAAHGGAKLLASAVGVGIIAGISHRRAVEERLRATADPAPEELLSEQGVRIR